MRPRFALLLLTVGIVGCIESPLEHTNYYDLRSSVTFSITGVPDTVNSIDEGFVAQLSSTPPIPAGAQEPVWSIVEGAEVLSRRALGEFRVTGNAGLVPVQVRIRATIGQVLNPPGAERVLVVRQRPASAALRCGSLEGCATIAGVGQDRLLVFELRDANNFIVNLPGGSFRYGNVVSRTPLVASVVARPSATVVHVRTESIGSAWIVFSDAAGVADSLLMTVIP